MTLATTEQPTPRRGMYTRDVTSAPASITLLLAIRVARKYARREPTVAELMDDYGMSRATAFRWLSAIRSA